MEDDLDDKEREIDEMKKNIEELETDNREKDKDLLNYKAQLDAANEEIKALRTKTAKKDDERANTAKRGEDEAKAEYEKRRKDYESMIEKLTKEVSSLQGRLSTANQKNKNLEEKVKCSKQVRNYLLGIIK